jgi:hypothetical protein
VTEFPKILGQGTTHAALMDLRRILETHRHYSPLEKTKRSRSRSERDVVRMHTCLEEAVGHVEFCPVPALRGIRENVVDPRKRCFVKPHVPVELSIVNNPAWKCCGVCLGNEEGRGCVMRV